MLTSTPMNSAFASFVEQEYLAHVDILVTLGNGGFQSSIIDQFLINSNGNRANLHRICLYF